MRNNNTTKQANTGAKRGAGFKGLLLLLFFIFFAAALTSCGNEPNREITLAVDKSGSTGSDLTSFDSEEDVNRNLEQCFGLADGKVIYYGCKLHLCAIGTSVRPRTLTLTLKPVGTPLLYNTQKRTNEIADFKKQIAAAVKSLMNMKADQQHSQIYLSLCSKLTELKNSDFGGVKRLIVLSDGLESNFHHEFINYADDVPGFRKDFPKIKQQMAATCNMPDLNGISVTMVNSPQHVLSDLILACDDFWREVIHDNGGTFIIKPNLNS